jgi:hypothetical protein
MYKLPPAELGGRLFAVIVMSNGVIIKADVCENVIRYILKADE